MTSQVSRAQAVGVTAMTSAERGAFFSSAISPKNSPGPISARGKAPAAVRECRTRTRPLLRITQSVRPVRHERRSSPKGRRWPGRCDRRRGGAQ